MPLLELKTKAEDMAPAAVGQAAGKDARPPLPPALQGRQARELTALEREFLPPLLEIQETPPSPTQRKLLWTLIALVVALIVWAALGQISVVSTAPGKFIPDGRVKQLQPIESSIVKAIHVREGQHVEQGELLLELDPTITGAELKANGDKYTLNQLEQSRLAAELNNTPVPSTGTTATQEQIALAERTRRAREQAYAAKLAQAQAELQEKTSAREAALATLKKYQESSAIAAEREASARPLLDNGAISRLDYLQLKQELLSGENDLATQEKVVAQAHAAQTAAEHHLAEVVRDRVAGIYNDLSEKVSSAPALKGDLDKSQQMYTLKWLKSPVSGFVQKVEVTTIGQVVSQAQNLVTIVPDGTPLIVEATLSNQDVGYVKVGQPVEIKVDTFPFQKYGALKGELVWVSADAEEKTAASGDIDTRTGSPTGGDGKASISRSGAGYVYKVHIRPNETSLVVNGEKTPIQTGMTVQADITTDHRHVIEFFLSPMVKYLDEGIKVR